MGAEGSRTIELVAAINEWVGDEADQRARERAIEAALSAHRRGESFERCLDIAKEAFGGAGRGDFHKLAREMPPPVA